MTKSFRISPVLPDLIDVVWPQAIKMLEPATDTSAGKILIGDVYKSVINGELVLWMILEEGAPVAFYTTRLIEYPNRRAMAVDWLGGSGLSSWMNEAVDAMEKQARANNCQHLECYGRLAWGRVLKRRGWKPEYVAYRMELDDG